MRFHFGFVSICLSEQSCSPAGNVTFASIKELAPAAQRLRILRTARRNLENTLRIMWFLRAHQIPLYRLSANLIPLATHPVTQGWAWWEEPELVETGRAIGKVARAEGYRLSSHLPEVCGLTSPQSFALLQAYLEYHRRLFDLLDLDESAVIVIHVGGAYGKKGAALADAKARLADLGAWERSRLALENDDRSYTLADVAALAVHGGVRAVCDWHHHVVNPGGASDAAALRELLAACASTWQIRPMKVHVSSPKNSSQVRAHAEYVDPAFVKPFFDALEELGLPAVDVMVEAKAKDLALFRLREAMGLERGDVRE